MKREILFTIAVTLVLAGIIRAAQDGTGTNVFESVRIKDGRSVTFGGVARTNWPEGGSTVFGVTDETAYRGDWGAVISNLVIYGPLLTNTTDVFFGRGAYAGYGGIAIGAGATNEEAGIAIGKDSRSGLVGISIGLFALSTESGVSIGRFAEADMYGIAIGDNASAVEDAVAIGGNVKNTNKNTTKILGKLIIPGGGPTNGAVWIATNTAGMGAWGKPAYFRAWITNNFYSSNAVTTYMKWDAPIGQVLYNVGFDGFDGTNLTIKTRGLYESVVCSYWKRAPGSLAQYLTYYLFRDASISAALELPHSLVTGYGFGSFPSGPILYNPGQKARVAIASPSGSTNYLPVTVPISRNFWSFRLVQELPP